MNAIKKLIFAAAVSFVAAQAHAEAILGVIYDAQGITYQVTSGGCTGKDDFELLQMESYPVRLSLRRIKQDSCEAYMPYGTKITYTWKELGWTSPMPFIISNQITRGQFMPE